MAGNLPHNQLAGIPLTIYTGPVGETVPDVDDTPAGNWLVLGPTTGDQTFALEGGVETFSDNDHLGPVKAIRPEQFVRGTFTLVDMQLEALARAISDVSEVASATGPPATKTLGLKRGAYPTEYALLFRGSVASPYGAYPAMIVIPRAVFEHEPELVYSKEGRVEHECIILALEDDAQGDEDHKMGWVVAQTA